MLRQAFSFSWLSLLMLSAACSRQGEPRVLERPEHPLLRVKSGGAARRAIQVDPNLDEPFSLGDHCTRWGDFPEELRTDQVRALWTELALSLGVQAQPRIEEAYSHAMRSLVQEITQILRAHKQRGLRSRFAQYTSHYGRWSSRDEELNFVTRALIPDLRCRGPIHAYLLQKWAEAIDPLVFIRSYETTLSVPVQAPTDDSYRWFHRSFGDAWVVSGGIAEATLPDLVEKVAAQAREREEERQDVIREQGGLTEPALLAPAVLQWVWDIRQGAPSAEMQQSLAAQLRQQLPAGFRVLTWIWAGQAASDALDPLAVWNLHFPVYYQSFGWCEKSVGSYRVQWACEPAQVLFRSTDQSLWMPVLAPERARRH